MIYTQKETAIKTVYRIQPVGLGIDTHCSELSSGDVDCGVHVFLSLADMRRGVNGWMDDETAPEILLIGCADEGLEDNEDFEGMTLITENATIIGRMPFASWDDLRECLEAATEER